MRKISFRGWLTIVTGVLLVAVIIGGWSDIMAAWALLNQVNLWILALLIPVQFLSYYVTGEIIFSYLKAKGELKTMSRWRMTRTALELNFVNHILPSGGAAGFSYLGWVLAKFGVKPGRSTMAQIIRFALTFLSFVVLLVVAVIVLIIDHEISRTVILLSFILAILAVGATIGGIYVIGSQARLQKFSAWLTKLSNRVVAKLTRGRKKNILKPTVLLEFFDDLHADFLQIRREKKVLWWPFVWALIANLFDVALLWISFWALGYPLNPATLFVAFGVSSIASAVSVTPGGAGVYEAVMIAFLASSGVPPEMAIAGTLIARISLLVLTIGFGYIFYQLTVNKYGRRPPLGQ
jgi:putative heme transporter